MPIYICKPGWFSDEPWRHGIQVYSFPFQLDDAEDTSTVIVGISGSGLPAASSSVGSQEPPGALQDRENSRMDTNVSTDDRTVRHRNTRSTVTSSSRKGQGAPVRRIRHAEIILVDQVTISYGRYWLRLRWPGSRGGFAGYIALSAVSPNERQAQIRSLTVGRTLQGINAVHSPPTSIQLVHVSRVTKNMEYSTDTVISASCEILSPEQVEQNNNILLDSSMPRSNDAEITGEEEEMHGIPRIPSKSINLLSLGQSLPSLPVCESSGLCYPTSPSLQLLVAYNDGLSDPVNADDSDSDGGEPVFCRICREGLHDVSYESLPGELDVPVSSASIRSRNLSDTLERENLSDYENHTKTETLNFSHMSLVNHPYAQNPLLAPCECSGSMAFVHYLCIEQWRCRSYHPSARNGAYCETCSKPYSLPPPPSRPSNHQGNAGVDNDWLDAMPPHVLHALRRPHIFWRIGAMIVRRRWLRPVAPVLMSPIVALYCRARRTLKKRGVSRRRWACSLCRRRARWKCVRCLRSYYCSRQCQNVSWHIVHKHVCYKPARFWWSVCVYGFCVFLLFPGILMHPLVYDFGLGMLMISFTVAGIIGGSLAFLVKRMAHVDMRGRTLELLVVLMTFFLTRVSWGLLWGYFGDNSKCLGVFPQYIFQRNDTSLSIFFDFFVVSLRLIFFEPGQRSIQSLDSILLKSGPFIRKFVCVFEDFTVCVNGSLPSENPSCPVLESTCLRTTQAINPNFFESPKCASDLRLTILFWLIAWVISMTGSLVGIMGRGRRLPFRGRMHVD